VLDKFFDRRWLPMSDKPKAKSQDFYYNKLKGELDIETDSISEEFDALLHAVSIQMSKFNRRMNKVDEYNKNWHEEFEEFVGKAGLYDFEREAINND
jgi:hypothetical protein